MKSSEIEKLRQQDPEMLSVLFADLAPRISKFVRSLHRTPPEEVTFDTDDIVMEVFSQLLRDPEKLADLAAAEKLETWCQLLARNITVHYFRRAEKRSLRESVTEIDVSQAVDTTQKPDEIAGLLESLLGKLSDVEQQIIIMRYVEGRTYREIANQLNQSEDSIRVRAFRAKAKLRAEVDRNTSRRA